MERRNFIKNGILGTIAMLTINDFAKAALDGKKSTRMPVMFAGHGSPMNAIEQNSFSNKWAELGRNMSRPKAILCISAHWMTNKGTYVTAMEKPQTIHDFGGFPQALFDAQYPAPGSPSLAQITADLVPGGKVKTSQEWGLDHGCWSVLLPMYPKADIPVYQLSLDLSQPAAYHYELGQQLKALRDQGVLIIGSGNIVHNLGRINWNGGAYDWAIEFDQWSKKKIESRDHQSLIQYEKQGKAALLSIPTNDHYLPLLYILGLMDKDEEFSFFNEETVMGSISMRSLLSRPR